MRISWSTIEWPRPLDVEQCSALMRALAADSRSPVVAFEARSRDGEVRYRLGVAPGNAAAVSGQLRAAVPGVIIVPPEISRADAINRAGSVRASTRHRALRLDDVVASSRALLSALATTAEEELAVVQVVLGPRRVPLAVSNHSPSSVVAPWWLALWHGDGGVIDGEKRSALRSKVSEHGFACTVRVGVRAATDGRRRALMSALTTALRTNENAGLRLRLIPLRGSRWRASTVPRWRWPLRLNISETLAVLGWPLGDDDLPGVTPLRPRRLAPVKGVATDDAKARIVAEAVVPVGGRWLTQSADSARAHSHVLGPTGVGKSILLGRLISQDIAAGRSVVVIEPRGDLIDDVLHRVPSEHQERVVVLDPASQAPVGINPLAAPGRSPEVIADGLLTVFRNLFADAWGPRLNDLTAASLVTLARTPGSTMLMLPLLLTNYRVRRQLTANLHEPVALEPFWAWYDSLSEGERSTVIAPLMTRLRPWLYSPLMRGVLGQSTPRFNLLDVFTQRKVLLVPLQAGVIGSEAARLLGSLLVAQLWQLIQSRAAIAPHLRHSVMLYIDEAQQYFHLNDDLGEALAQARGLGCAFTLAHQELHQASPAMRAALLTNARSRIYFQLGHEDASLIARGRPEIDAEDFTHLNAYEVYASLFSGGRVTPFAMGRTLAPSKPFSDAAAIRRASAARYGRPISEVDQEIAAMLDLSVAAGPVSGRRRRGAHD